MTSEAFFANAAALLYKYRYLTVFLAGDTMDCLGYVALWGAVLTCMLATVLLAGGYGYWLDEHGFPPAPFPEGCERPHD